MAGVALEGGDGRPYRGTAQGPSSLGSTDAGFGLAGTDSSEAT
jgi:hypothetical protein